jgi:polyisoprenoid-binding protein YceI
MRAITPALACAAWLAAAGTVAGQDTSFQIDPAHTKVEFTLADVLHTVRGTFQLKCGDFRFDPASGTASGQLVVDAASGNSGNAARDRRMHSNILQSDRYPEIVWRPDRVTGNIAPEGSSQVSLHGMFRIHGADHEVTMPLTVAAAGGQYNASATFQVPYVKWGMKNPSTLFLRVSDTVNITIQTVARIAPAPAR